MKAIVVTIPTDVIRQALDIPQGLLLIMPGQSAASDESQTCKIVLCGNYLPDWAETDGEAVPATIRWTDEGAEFYPVQ